MSTPISNVRFRVCDVEGYASITTYAKHGTTVLQNKDAAIREVGIVKTRYGSLFAAACRLRWRSIGVFQTLAIAASAA